MTPRERDPPPSSGLFSHVFSFVSRELESFVATAAGGTVAQKPPRASSSRVKLDARPQNDGEVREIPAKRNRSRVKKKKEETGAVRRRKARSPTPPESGSSANESDEPHRASRRYAKIPNTPRPRTSESPPRFSPAKRQLSNENPVDVAQNCIPPTASSPSPPPLSRFLRRRPSVTMPGSLFPRSASLEPDTPQPDDGRHVRFAPGIPSPPHRSYVELLVQQDDALANDSPTKEIPDSRGEDDAPASTTPDMRTSRTVEASLKRTSVKMPPQDTTPSPSKGRPMADITQHSGPAARTVEDEERPTYPSKSKGKERARDWDDFFAPAETSGEIRVRGKERELSEALEEHLRKEHDREMSLDPDQTMYMEERERDKERIRTLEQEIESLRNQLAEQRRRAEPRHNTPSSMGPPPPPPPAPPPPPLFGTLSTTITGIRNLPGSGSAAATDSFLASARASLRPTGLPVEAPINAPAIGRTKKTGHFTVNIPTDKMATFLSEVKNARLRKVGGSVSSPFAVSPAAGSRSMAAPSESSPLVERTSAGGVLIGSGKGRDILRDMATRKSLGLSRSFEAEPQTGEKRKRDVADDASFLAPDVPAKRRFISSSFSEASSSLFASESGQRGSQRPDADAPYNRTWPSISTTATDLTTPSLSSDNGDEQELSPRSRHPRTPPPEQPPSRPSLKISTQAEVIDVDAIPERPVPRPPTLSPPENPARITPNKESSTQRDLFVMRPPTSPMPPDPSPRKPLAPARARARLPAPNFATNGDADANRSDSQDPLAIIPPPPSPKRSSASRTATTTKKDRKKKSETTSTARQQQPKQTSSSSSSAKRPNAHPHSPGSASHRVRRRRTLDDELRRAGDSLWVEEHGKEDGLESGEIVGVGTRSKRRGFLAGGGAAGTPVFMGVGYVEGAEEDDDEP